MTDVVVDLLERLERGTRRGGAREVDDPAPPSTRGTGESSSTSGRTSKPDVVWTAAVACDGCEWPDVCRTDGTCWTAEGEYLRTLEHAFGRRQPPRTRIDDVREALAALPTPRRVEYEDDRPTLPGTVRPESGYFDALVNAEGKLTQDRIDQAQALAAFGVTAAELATRFVSEWGYRTERRLAFELRPYLHGVGRLPEGPAFVRPGSRHAQLIALYDRDRVKVVERLEVELREEARKGIKAGKGPASKITHEQLETARLAVEAGATMQGFARGHWKAWGYKNSDACRFALRSLFVQRGWPTGRRGRVAA